MKTTMHIQGIAADLYGLGKVFHENSNHDLVVSSNIEGFSENIGYEIYPSDEKIAVVTGTGLDILESAESHAAIEWLCYGIVEGLNACGYLMDPNYKPVWPTGYSIYCSSGGRAGSLGGGYYNRIRTSLGRLKQHEELAQNILDITKNNYTVGRVFSVLRARPSWVAYYLIFEEVAHDRGLTISKLFQTGYLTRKQNKEFTKAANNSEKLSEGPRHGGRKTAVKQADLMTILEAEQLVRNVVYSWTNDLCNHRMPTECIDHMGETRFGIFD